MHSKRGYVDKSERQTRETWGEWLGEVGAIIGGRLYKVSQFIQGIPLELGANDSISFHFCTKKICLHKLGPNQLAKCHGQRTVYKYNSQALSSMPAADIDVSADFVDESNRLVPVKL